jgi:dolichol-phosphate mannosyltransferase
LRAEEETAYLPNERLGAELEGRLRRVEERPAPVASSGDPIPAVADPAGAPPMPPRDPQRERVSDPLNETAFVPVHVRPHDSFDGPPLLGPPAAPAAQTASNGPTAPQPSAAEAALPHRAAVRRYDPIVRPFVVIATYNERANIDRLIEQVLGADPRLAVVVVDDNSPDGTADVVRQLSRRHEGRILLHERAGKFGYGTAFAEGIARARKAGASAIVSMDADFSHDPGEVGAMLERLAATGADIVVGSRYCGGVRVLNWQFYRLILSVWANFYARTLLNLPAMDVTSGFRVYRAPVFDNVDPATVSARGYAFLVELLYRLHRRGATMVEHPIVFSERRDGQSKMSKGIIVEAALRPWVLLAKRLLRLL